MRQYKSSTFILKIIIVLVILPLKYKEITWKIYTIVRDLPQTTLNLC